MMSSAYSLPWNAKNYYEDSAFHEDLENEYSSPASAGSDYEELSHRKKSSAGLSLVESVLSDSLDLGDDLKTKERILQSQVHCIHRVSRAKLFSPVELHFALPQAKFLSSERRRWWQKAKTGQEGRRRVIHFSGKFQRVTLSAKRFDEEAKQSPFDLQRDKKALPPNAKNYAAGDYLR